jgi:anti-sigma-K factor RskA
MLQVSEHLAACPACREELRQYQAVVDQLALATPLAEPPAALKDKLMGQVQRRVQPVEGKLSFWQRLVALFGRTAPAWGLASFALVLVLAASNLLLWRQLGQISTAQPEMRVIKLSSTNAVAPANGLIVISTDGNHGTLVVDELPVLPDTQEYQLWLIRDGKRTSGGIFSVSRDGYGSLWVHSPEPLASYSSFGITVEPAGGSPAPSGSKVLGGSL